MLALIHIAGGVALVLYGVRSLRHGLDRLFGARLAQWLQRASRNRVKGAGIGAAVSVLAPSSTTIAMLGAELVNARAIRLDGLWSIMLGAAVGITAMVQLIALDVSAVGPALLLVGVLFLYRGKRNALMGFGEATMSLGLVFLAVWIIQLAAASIRVEPGGDLETILKLLESHAWGLAAASAVLSVALQSGTATLGLIIGLVQGGLLPDGVVFPCVLGVNVGLGCTQFLFAYGTPEGRRLGLAMLTSRITVAAALTFAAPWVAPWLLEVSGSLPRFVANAHTGFGLLMLVAWLPLVPIATPLIERLISESSTDGDPGAPMFLRPGYVQTPALAFGQSMREILRASELVRSMLVDFWTALAERDLDLCDDIVRRDDIVDALDGHIKRYLTQLGGESYGPAESATQVAHLRYIGELETIGDIVDKNLVELVRKLIRTGGYFSDQGFEELKRAYGMVMENFDIAATAFATQNADLAEKLIRHKRHLQRLDLELRQRHFARLQRGLAESVETSAIHLDLLTYLKQINSHLTAVAYPILDQAGRPHPKAPGSAETGATAEAETEPAESGAPQPTS